MPDLSAIAERTLAGEPLGRDDALRLATEAGTDELFFHANRLRERFHGNRVHVCSIINARSGACPEDCAFCPQSGHHHTHADVYPLVPEAQMVDEAGRSVAQGADRFGIVTSGESAAEGDFETICRAVRRIHEAGSVAPCASIGRLGPAEFERLRAAGLRRIHHNLETSERFFPQICTTHARADRVATVRDAKAAGMEVCSGGLFGLGETWEDRVDLALELRDLGVDAVPINFLHPVPGTALEGRPLLAPLEALRIVAVFRFVHPTKEIKVCGGRHVVLRDLQSWIFRAGASGMMTGHYLTTQGRRPADDLQMLADLGLTPHGVAP